MYMAPELFGTGGGDKSVDIRAFGIVLYEVLFNVESYAEMNTDLIPVFGMQGKRPALGCTQGLTVK